MPVAPETIHRHLAKLPQRRSLDAALELFDTLGYQYADELPLPIRNWPTGVRRLVRDNADPPIYLARHRDFRVVYTHLTADHLSRTVERPIVEQTLHRLHPYALFLFTNRDLTQWDFVNVKYVAEDGARRRTIRRIHVGPAERLHTAAQRMALLAVPGPDTTALELQSLHDRAFDVEEVTRQFYRDYVEVFGALCDDVARRNPRRVAGTTEAEREAQVLLDRLLFLYFIQKKGWLDGRRDYLHQHFQAHCEADPDGTGFYSDFLFPLFVALSNEGVTLPSLGDVPFLNGGLFEVPAEAPLADQLVVGNGVFRHVFDDLLERYNFTVREDTPLDVEVAIDPEMLGQIFENLVLGLERGEDRRKATGSYYTPRVIVHFMCRQALKQYLAAESGLDPARIERLMDLGPAEQLTPEEVAELREMVTEPEARLLRALVEGARTLDPAVGSGAFLVGMLYEMVALTKLLDARLHGQQRVRRRNTDYDLKRGFIERNLYGVDIQPEAVRICELRLWLSLIVDYEREAGEPVPPLPNLSYRVRVGDSLIERLFGEPVQLDQLADDAVARGLIDRIQTEKRGYFKEPDLAEKRRRELRILELMCELTARLVGAKRGAVLTQMSAQVPPMGDEFLSREQRQLKEAFEAELARYDRMMGQAKAVYERVLGMQASELPAGARDVGALREQLGLSFIWRLDFAEVFADKGGFDVVIANPPYVSFGLRGAKQAKRKWTDYMRTYYPHSAEYKLSTYAIFMDKGIQLMQASGTLCYVVPDSFLLGRYFSKLRRWILDTTSISTIVMFTTDFWQSGVVGRPVIISLDRQPDIVTREQNEVTARLCTDLSEVERGEVSKAYSYGQSYFEGIAFNRFRLFFDETSKAFVEKVESKAIEARELVSIHTGVRSKIGQKNIVSTRRESLTWYRGLISGGEIRRYFLDYAGHYINIDPQLLWSGGWDKGIIELEKLLMRQTGNSLIATFDGNGYYHLNNLHSIVLRDDADHDLKYILAILNSKLLNHYYHLISLELGRAMAQTDIETLEKLPIRCINFDDPVDVARHDRMVALVERMLALHKALQSAREADHAALEQQIAETDAEIDALVYELYELTEEEIAIVEGQNR